MKLKTKTIVIIFTTLFITTCNFLNLSHAQVCHFTNDVNWDKSTDPDTYTCTGVGYTPDNATTIYIDAGVEVIIDKQTTDIEWIADVIVEGTLILKTQLTLSEPSDCDLTLTIATGGILTTSGGGGANELLIICGNIILSNSQGDGIYDWADYPGGVTGPQSIDDTGGTLPVELLNFNAKSSQNQVVLTWSTASETNNDYFTIEKSKNGIDFVEIGTVTGNGTINTISNYSFTDNSPYLGLSYYRLSQTDYDGTTEVFQIISALSNYTTTGFSISPNPVSNPSMKLKVSGKAKNELIELNIVDLQGRLVEQKFFKADDYGNVETEFQLKRQLQKGTYIFELISDGQKEYLKVMGK